uniref:DNA damage-binding protein 1 n=1 Tax=Heterorhabditis bacteriophora TaxID=37862 RepID=A0A1I7WFC4_HETBA
MLCKKLVSEVSMYTDFSGYEHLIEKELNHHSITLGECREMIANKKYGYGTLTKAANSGLIWSTKNKIEPNYPNRFTSMFSPKRYYKENCVIIETKVYSHFNQSRPSNVLADMNNCKYSDGFCEIKKNELIVWDVNNDQMCQYISIGEQDGIYNNGLWINSKNEIALSFTENKSIRDCKLDLLESDEGFAVKRINVNKPNPQKYVNEQQPSSTGLNQHLKNKNKINYANNSELKCLNKRRDKSSMNWKLKNLEKRRDEKLKKQQEFEKKKQEKVLRQSTPIPQIVNTNKTKREVPDDSNDLTEEDWRPLPLPTYDEYLKTKHECDILPSYTEFKKLEKLNMKEFQYLENKSNNLLRHTTEVMCDIFNEQSEILETLIRDNPRRYIQKQLNHSAIRVKVLSDSEGMDIVQVTFCKSLEDEEIEFVDLTNFGIEGSLALTQGQIPVRVKAYGDKIWYYKNDNSGGIISSNLQLHPKINNITNFKDFEDFDLKFLDDKVIFHEHILLDTKTNIEEDIINEMREKSDVESIFGKYYIRIWRVYVTIGVTLFYIFIVRSFWMFLSPKTFFKSNGSRFRKLFFYFLFKLNISERSFIIISPKEKDKIELVEFTAVLEKENKTEKDLKHEDNLKTGGTNKLNKKNITFIKINWIIFIIYQLQCNHITITHNLMVNQIYWFKLYDFSRTNTFYRKFAYYITLIPSILTIAILSTLKS